MTDAVSKSPFHHVSDKLIHEGAIISFFEGTFAGPDGVTFKRDIIRHPGAVSAVAVEDGHVFLVRQYRAALDADLWEIPAGKRDIADEPPEVTAARELEEEIGMNAGSLVELMIIHQSPGFCDEDQYIYLATDLTPVPQRLDGIEEQHLVVDRVTTDQAIAMCLDGRITDAKSICGILAAARTLGW